MKGGRIAALVLLLMLLRPRPLHADVETKEGVSLAHLSPHMRAGLEVIGQVSRRVIGRAAIVTATFDGVHRDGSLHYTHNAVDLRTRDLTAIQIAAYAAALRAALGPPFEVLVEDDHIHVEYDPR